MASLAYEPQTLADVERAKAARMRLGLVRRVTSPVVTHVWAKSRSVGSRKVIAFSDDHDAHIAVWRSAQDICHVTDGIELDLVPNESPRRKVRDINDPTVKDILIATCEHYRLTMIDLLSKRRTADLVKPRQIAMYLAKELTVLSLPNIGLQMDGRDHTTILHGANKISRMIEEDRSLFF